MSSQHSAQRRVPVNFRLPAVLRARIQAVAAERGETVTELVIRALEREVITPPPDQRE